MQQLDVAIAKHKVLQDIRHYIAEIQRITQSPIETVEDGIRTLAALRETTYEDLNQIQHEYATLCAIQWLVSQSHVPEGVRWRWHPRQTGGADEPDICATMECQVILSGEVTTSPEPKGLIDSRMRDTLQKLAGMEGRRYYFVLSDAMAARARTKIQKAGHDIEVVRL